MAVAQSPYEPALFFPASLVIVVARYLVFVSLYGMRLYAVSAAALITVGWLGLFWGPSTGPPWPPWGPPSPMLPASPPAPRPRTVSTWQDLGFDLV